jgi:ubiquinone/menaquinone biosynthesis C-methylase UbiE
MSTPISNPAAAKPTNERILDALNAYQRTAAIKSALDLDVFTVIGRGQTTAATIAAACRASERGIRILCDHLTVQGFLTKQGSNYALAPDAQVFLDRNSPACVADAATGFFASRETISSFDSLTEAVRKGGTAKSAEGTMGPEDPVWVDFAVSMINMQTPSAHGIAKILNAEAGQPWKVLDVASGHGLFGIVIASKNPNAEIYSQDWAPVLAVAQKNADAAGVSSRFRKIPGSAFEVDLGSGYDLILLTNFLQLLDPRSIETILKKVHAALKPGGRVVTLGFIPNDDRVSPPIPAAFSLMMLATTPGGDAWSFADYEKLFRAAGFQTNTLVPMPAGPQNVIISTK